MREMVLYYTPAPAPHTAKLKGVLARMGIRIKNIGPEQVTQQIGALAGVAGYQEVPVPACLSLPTIQEEMLVMHQFTGRRLDELLAALRKAGVPRINLKAVVTETNCPWSFYELYEELKREHEAMTAASKQ